MASPSDEVAVICLQLMVPAVVFLVLVLLFIFLLYFFAKYYMGSRSSLFTFSSPRNQQLIPISNHGLTPQLLASLPITVFTPSMYKEGLECSVCLDQLSEGEKLRTLPKCSHGFHVNCIDMWFQSHTTCPLCRTAVITEEVVEPEEVCVGGVSTELSEIPTNVLFWGNQDGVSNGVASTQVASDEEGSSSSSSLYPKEMEEMKTPRSGRLRSFRRLLSRGKMVADVEGVGAV